MRSAFAYVTKKTLRMVSEKIYQFLGSCCKIIIPCTKFIPTWQETFGFNRMFLNSTVKVRYAITDD